MAGALGSLRPARREAIWQATALGGEGLVANIIADEDTLSFAPLSQDDEMQLDYVHAQSFIEAHHLQLHRQALAEQRVLRATYLVRCKAGTLVEVAGVVIVRQRPGGGKMIFMALEDETVLVDIAVPLSLFERNRPLIMLSSMLIIGGQLQLDGRARSVFAHSFRQLGHDTSIRSRNFH